MKLQHLSVSLFGAIAAISMVLAAATIWLLLTNPVTMANAVNEGEITPLVRDLAQILFEALRGLLKYLLGACLSRNTLQRSLEEAGEQPRIDEFERRLPAAVMTARQDGQLVRKATLAELTHQVL